jgi:cobalt-zinc-cadmium efflux system outer membrane protein
MRMGTTALAVCALACFGASSAAAQGRSMTLADVLARAREQAPQIVSARLALEETRARLIGASLRQQNNPELDAAIGNRNGPTDRFTDFQLGVAQAFEPGARRSARIEGANAAIAEGTANIDDVTRAVLRQAGAAYYRALHANERIKLLNAEFELASNVYSAADRRYRAGDIAVLDVNIARASLARVRAQREGAEATKALTLGDLRQLLRLPDDVSIEGSLGPATPADLNAALQAASERPDLRALQAGIQEAEAQLRLGMSFSKPEFGVGVRYSHEEGDQIVLGGMTVTLPMFSKGQEQRALGSARATRLRAELDAARTRVQIEVRTAFAAYNRRLAAIRALEADAIPGLDENEQLTTRSFEVGQLGLPDLLLIRRETLDTRFQYLDSLLEAALARIDLDASAGVLR